MPRPTSPIDDAGPLKGKIPPTLISVAVTPGVSAAKADVASARVSAPAAASALNIGLSSFAVSATAACPKARLSCWRRGQVHDSPEFEVLFLHLSSDTLTWT